MTDPTVQRAANDWMRIDPQSLPELTHLLEKAATDPAALADLNDRFGHHLTFGTAGLRAAMGAGPNRMNAITVSWASAGLARWLTSSHAEVPHVVVGFDARRNSRDFARHTTEVLAGAGLDVSLFPSPVPTPLLAFAVRHLFASAGVMITASHNPAQDNGYKVYLDDGRQLVSPADNEIAVAISDIADAHPTAATLPRDQTIEVLDGGVERSYIEQAARIVESLPVSTLTVVSTAMHGVGGELLRKVFDAAGAPMLITVTEQQQPDGEFPTVALPNPEEPAALELATKVATQHRADLVIALDPDADRCAVAVPTVNGQWQRLSGDDVGCLLAHWLSVNGLRGTLATTVVSSQRLRAIAAAFGNECEITLTGFKWLARVPNLTFAYEEAIGYCVAPQLVADKDGLTAALLVGSLAAELKATDRTLLDALDDLDETYGVHHTDHLALAGSWPGDPATPATLGGLSVTNADNLRDQPDALPPTTGVRWWLAGPTDGNARVVVRPSGTEPKIKAYLEVVVPVTPIRPVTTARQIAKDSSEGVIRELRAWLSTWLGNQA